QNNATGLISVLYTDTDNPAQTMINSNRFTNQGRIESDSLVINLNTFRNEGNIHSESLNADIVNAFDNNGFIVVAGNADVSAKNFNNLNQAGDNPEFSVGGRLILMSDQITNQSGSVIAMHSGDLHTLNLFNRAGGSISALTGMTISGIDGLDTVDRASVVDNYGEIITGADLSVSSNRITNRADAVLSSARNARLSFDQLQNNSLIVVER